MPMDENSSESEISEQEVDQNQIYRQTLERVDKLLSDKRNVKRKVKPVEEVIENESDINEALIEYLNDQIELLQQEFANDRNIVYRNQAIEHLDKLLELGTITSATKKQILNQFFK